MAGSAGASALELGAYRAGLVFCEVEHARGQLASILGGDRLHSSSHQCVQPHMLS